MSFSAVSVAHWWVLGSVPCGDRNCLRIVTTTDGGASFQSLPAPGAPFGPAGNAPPVAGQIRFADARDGWVFGPGLYATHDGGRHWAAASVGGAVTDLEPGLGQVFAVATPPEPPCARTGTCGAGAPAPRLWRTRPESDAWSPDPAAGGVSLGLAVHGRSVWILDSMRTRGAPAIGTHLRHSADGGDHFATQPGAIPAVACFYSPVSDTVLWSYCSGGHLMYAYISADAGRHFSGVGPAAGTQPTPNSHPNGSTLAAASPGTAVAASSLPGQPLIRSADGGARWTVVQKPPDGTGNWSVIGFTTPDTGYAFWQHPGATYAASTARLWRTTDAGATWSPVTALP
jgi:photosystem II stability/assembly factor-like uncharacterized protein